MALKWRAGQSPNTENLKISLLLLPEKEEVFYLDQFDVSKYQCVMIS
jgi:hypothetical protein